MNRAELLVKLRTLFPRMCQRDLVDSSDKNVVQFFLPGTSEVKDPNPQDRITLAMMDELASTFNTRDILLKFGVGHVCCMIRLPKE